jgi:hypothetical protein
MKSASNNTQILHKISTIIILTLEQQLVRQGITNGGSVVFSYVFLYLFGWLSFLYIGIERRPLSDVNVRILRIEG